MEALRWKSSAMASEMMRAWSSVGRVRMWWLRAMVVMVVWTVLYWLCGW